MKQLIESFWSSKSRGTGAAPTRTDGVRWTVSGLATLLSGQKLPALGMFGRGILILEKHWRDEHPEVGPSLRERIEAALAHYEANHQHPKNRMLHLIGIPMIAGGTLGLLLTPAFQPLWWGSAGLFVVGWQLNIAGHLFFEKNRPAFAEDPLSFVVGPIWDAKQLFARLAGT